MMGALNPGWMLGLLVALAPLCAIAQSAPLFFHGGAAYSADSGNTDQSLVTLPGFNSVPYLWRFDPMPNGLPSARTRNTYVNQEKGAIASPARTWRSFFVYQDAAGVIGGNPANANDIANTVSWWQSQNYPIDYVFADLEGYYPDGDWSNTLNMIDRVRSSPVGTNTRIGNFDMYRGPANLGTDYPFFSDRRKASADYMLNASNGMAGLTVAMPEGYQTQALSLHADPGSWAANWWSLTGLPSDSASLASFLTYNQRAAIGASYTSPNQRAGLFYGPLEKISLAKRNLPAGHQFIPWVGTFIPDAGVPLLQPRQAPTLPDTTALLEHFRLRGADGFYAFSEQVPAYIGSYSDGSTYTIPAYYAYAAQLQVTWTGMDWFFHLPAQVGGINANRPLNLYTFKNTGGTYVDPNGRNGGIEWSAYQRGNRVLAVISNLGNGAQAATGKGVGQDGNWQAVFTGLSARLPGVSPIVPAGGHLVMQFLTNPTVAGFGSYTLGSALGAAQGWHDSAADFTVHAAAGSGNSGNQVVSITGGKATAWFANAATANPGGIGATANDTMTYKFKVFTGWSGSGSAAFAPVVGSGSAVPVPVQQDGPTLWVYTGGAQHYWAFGSNSASGGPYHSTNFAPAANTWYAVEMIVNPAKDLATIYAANLTAGNASWTLLQFVDTRNTSGQTLTSLGAGLIAGQESPSLYNGFQISGSAGAQFDDLSAQIYPFPASPLSSYAPVQPPPPPASTTGTDNGSGSTDAPVPAWALLALAAGILGIGSRRLPSRRRPSIGPPNAGER